METSSSSTDGVPLDIKSYSFLPSIFLHANLFIFLSKILFKFELISVKGISFAKYSFFLNRVREFNGQPSLIPLFFWFERLSNTIPFFALVSVDFLTV